MTKTGATVSNPRSRVKWDAFPSFQRVDTSNNFTERLYEALVKEEVRVWNEDVEGGDDDELRPSLVEAIDDSVAFVVVLSPNYADSHLRLEELTKLCGLKSSLKRLVFPIFYKVEPWEVKTQEGCFEKHFEEYSKRFGKEKIQPWKESMELVGNISGLIYGEFFCERLYVALNVKRIFRDNEGMERGDTIGPSLILAMEDSAASVIILSHNYANYRWCLDELAMLCDLRASLERPMIPVFYGVHPSAVRKQSGDFAKHLEVLGEKYDEEQIQRWKRAMTIVGNIPGFVCTAKTVEDDNEGKDRKKVDDMIKLVVKKVKPEVRNTPKNVGEYTVGLESRVEDLTDLLDFSSTSGVQILGLYGMGGIGKTTLAKSFYNKVIVNFESHRVFIENVRERSSDQDGIVNLQKEYIKELTRSVPQIEDVNIGREMVKEKVHEKKIVAVIDDVDNIDQVDALVGETRWYSEGSLIVITTRDEEVLDSLSVNQRYEVKCLTEEQALKLFSFYALRKEHPPTDSLLELSKKIFEITGLLPLAVKVFGSHLYDKDEDEWRVELEKLKKIQPGKLHSVLALSFESLDDEEKKIFLDIACLFLRMEITKEEVVDVLKGCGLNAEPALKVLIQKSLLRFMNDDTLSMHDQIRDMGREIVLKESRDDLGMRSRLWNRGEIMNV